MFPTGSSTKTMINIKFEQYSISIDSNIIKLVFANRQVALTATESGGMLLGSIFTTGHEMVLRDYTIPLEGDVQSRCRFIRKKESHNRLLHHKWKESNKTLMYMGEWHTHPEKNPQHSLKDLKNWRKLLHESNTFSNFLFFIIGGIDLYKVWMGNRKTGDIVLIYKGVYHEIN
jgi:integrative and conjugative element protein (TIGR02256 family)